MSDIDIKDIDFDAMHSCGVSMIELGAMYLYIYELINNPDIDIAQDLAKDIMVLVKDQFQELQQDYYKDKEIYHLGEKIGFLLEDFLEWKDVLAEMGLCYDSNE